MSVDTVKSLATSMLSAGVVAKIAIGLNIDITKLSKSDLLGRLEYNLAKNSVGAVVNLGMYGKYEQGAIGGVIDALLSSILAPMLDKVDKLTAAADFSESGREWTRILVAGGVRGAITGRDTMDGILSGIAEEYVTAKCNGIVAEWEREDKIREMAEAIGRDGFLDASKDQASSSSAIKKPVSRNKDNASSSNSSDINRGKTRERSQGYFSKEDLKYNSDDFISSIFTDPKALAEYEKYTAEREQYKFLGNNDFSVDGVPSNRHRDANKIINFMLPTAYGSEKDSYHHETAQENACIFINKFGMWLSKAYKASKGENSTEVVNWQLQNRKFATKLGYFSDVLREAVEYYDSPIRDFKYESIQNFNDKINQVSLNLDRLDLAVSKKLIFHGQKLYYQTGSAVAGWLPGSVADIGAAISDLGLMMIGADKVAGATVKGLERLQFAYDAYRKTQNMANRPPSDRIQHEALKTTYRQKMEQPHIQDPKLSKIVKELYKPNSKIGSGSTADAVRREITSNQKVGGKWHLKKSNDAIKCLEDWLQNNQQASPGDRAAAENILLDLKDAIGQKEWYSQTKPPKP